jgi:effector-binding domain-containing protein
LEDLAWLKDLLKTKVHLTRNALCVETGAVLIQEQLTEEILITTPYNDTDDEKKIALAVAEHLNYCHGLDIYSAYSIGGMIPTDRVPTEKDYNYSHFYTKLSKNEYQAANDRKPCGTYAVIYHKGGYETASLDYSKLVEYINAHGYTMGDYFYEDVLLDELSMKGYDNYVLKISVQCNPYTSTDVRISRT